MYRLVQEYGMQLWAAELNHHADMPICVVAQVKEHDGHAGACLWLAWSRCPTVVAVAAVAAAADMAVAPLSACDRCWWRVPPQVCCPDRADCSAAWGRVPRPRLPLVSYGPAALPRCLSPRRR